MANSRTSERRPKQVLVIRTDLNMRAGKMTAQGAHASLGAVLLIQNKRKSFSKSTLEAVDEWLGGEFTKICLRVSSEDELVEIYNQALNAGLPVKLVTDAGHTVFHGVPTKTCLAIGPAWSDDIDAITGKLSLI